MMPETGSGLFRTAQLSVKQCCDCHAMSLQRLSNASYFNPFLLRNCVAPKSECRTRDVLRCSHALTSKMFDDQAECRQISSASKASLCNSDCQSVISVRPTMAGAKSLAVGDVVVCALVMAFKVAMLCSSCKNECLYFFLFLAILATISQIIMESLMYDRYKKGGSQEWLSGCEILSACSTEQGPASAASQIYNDVENMMKIVIVEIVGNFFNLVLMAASTYSIHQEISQPAGSSPSRAHVVLCVNVFEMLLEIGQVACSALALKSMDGSIKPVNELISSLVGTFSENAGLCLLPCCGSSSGNQITC